MKCFLMMMRFNVTLRSVLLLSASFMSTIAKILYVDTEVCGCSGSYKEFVEENDGDELFHSDFIKHELVINKPVFAEPIDWTGFYGFSVSELAICEHNLEVSVLSFHLPEAVDAPDSFIYTKNDVELGTENTLICHVSGFYPPTVHVNWTKNTVDITDRSTLSQFYPKEDGTYRQFSHLSFTPQQGDVYTCTVHHKGLQSPLSRTLVVYVEQLSIVPSMFCAVGLLVGLLGAAAGTFFFIRGHISI